jgi:hypothetical protein
LLLGPALPATGICAAPDTPATDIYAITGPPATSIYSTTGCPATSIYATTGPPSTGIYATTGPPASLPHHCCATGFPATSIFAAPPLLPCHHRLCCHWPPCHLHTGICSAVLLACLASLPLAFLPHHHCPPLPPTSMLSLASLPPASAYATTGNPATAQHQFVCNWPPATRCMPLGDINPLTEDHTRGGE